MGLSVLRRIFSFACIAVIFSGVSGCAYMRSARFKGDMGGSDYRGMYEQLLQRQPPEIISIRFGETDGNISRHGNWVELKSKVTIHIALDGRATMVELYITPTGTQTYKLQRLIDVVYPKNGVAEYTWDVPEGTMGHFWVVAYNRDVGRKSETINVIREELK